MEFKAVASNPGGRATSRVAGRVARIPRHRLRLAAMALGGVIILPQLLGILSSAAVSPGAKLLTASGVLMIGATWFEASAMERHNLLADVMFAAWVFALALAQSSGLLVLGLMVTFALVRPLFGPSLSHLGAASVVAVGAYSV